MKIAPHLIQAEEILDDMKRYTKKLQLEEDIKQAA